MVKNKGNGYKCNLVIESTMEVTKLNSIISDFTENAVYSTKVVLISHSVDRGLGEILKSLDRTEV